jgi:hypothetical protein
MTEPEEIARLLSEGTKSFFHGCAPESFDMNLKRGRLQKGTYVTSYLSDAITYGLIIDHSWRSREEWWKLADQGSSPDLSHVIEIGINGRFGFDVDVFDSVVTASGDPEYAIYNLIPQFAQHMSQKDGDKLLAIYKDFAYDPVRQGQDNVQLLDDWRKISKNFENIPLINPEESGWLSRYITLESMPIKGAYVFSPVNQGQQLKCTKVVIQGTIKLGHTTISGDWVF